MIGSHHIKDQEMTPAILRRHVLESSRDKQEVSVSAESLMKAGLSKDLTTLTSWLNTLPDLEWHLFSPSQQALILYFKKKEKENNHV